MFLNKLEKQKTGFTLVELLVVIAILGILSSFAMVNLNIAKAKARDARRLSDITQIRKALEVYNYIEGDTYPAQDGTCTGLLAVAGCLSAFNVDWIPGLGSIPSDPINATVEGELFYYFYQVIEASPVNHYLLMYNLETAPRKSECAGLGYSAAFSCVSIGVN